MGDEELSPARLAAANINPKTRLATDYLNHFNNVVMLLELIGSMPECADEIMAWEPQSYPDYFRTSNYRERDLAIAAFEAADPKVRAGFEDLVRQLDEAMDEAKLLLALCESVDDEIAIRIGMLVGERMKPLISEASGVINGRKPIEDTHSDEAAAAAQASIDELFA